MKLASCLITGAIVLLVIAGTGCAPARTPMAIREAEAVGTPTVPPAPRQNSNYQRATAPGEAGPNASATPAGQRILVYSGRFAVAVASIEAALLNVQRLAEESGGYMLTMSGEAITIRIPARQFFATVEKLKALGQVIDKQITAKDVTDEYLDLQLRLKNAEALRERLSAILAEAKTVKDTLEVERELNRVREEIERIKGQLAKLDQQIAYSTIEVVFSQAQEQRARVRRPEAPFAWLDMLGVEQVLRIRD